MVPHSPVRTYAYQPFLGDLQVSRKFHGGSIQQIQQAIPPKPKEVKLQFPGTSVTISGDYTDNLVTQISSAVLTQWENKQATNQPANPKKKKKKTHRTAALWAKYKKMRDELRKKTMENDKQN
uniref:Uncharacterized protein n=2 Tax=Lutzomyia longipalpis TaxID=7200 RepID=A0A1B0CCG7_LUTLO